MGVWECGNPAPGAGFPKRGGGSLVERPPRCHFHSPGPASPAAPNEAKNAKSGRK